MTTMKEKGDYLLSKGWKRRGWKWRKEDGEAISMSEALELENSPQAVGPAVVLPAMPETVKATIAKNRKPKHVSAGFAEEVVAMLEARKDPTPPTKPRAKTWEQLTAEAERLYA